MCPRPRTAQSDRPAPVLARTADGQPHVPRRWHHLVQLNRPAQPWVSGGRRFVDGAGHGCGLRGRGGHQSGRRPVRDLFFDRSQFLQKMIGDGTTGEILKQLDEIDETERDFSPSEALRQTPNGLDRPPVPTSPSLIRAGTGGRWDELRLRINSRRATGLGRVPRRIRAQSGSSCPDISVPSSNTTATPSSWCRARRGTSAGRVR
jgi:hypothetical protein